MFDLARVENGEEIPDNTAPKKLPATFVKNYYSDPQYEFGDKTEGTKNLSQQMGFVTRFLNGDFQEIIVKLNESRLLKFYQVKQLKENSTENSAEKNFKEDSQFNEQWNFSTKQNQQTKKKEKKNTQIQRTSFPGHSLR